MKKEKDIKKGTKKNIPLVKIIIGAAFVFVVLAFLALWGTGRIAVFKYNAGAPTASKFAKISKWIPSDAEFSVAVDVPRALSNPELKEKLSAAVKGRDDVAGELASALLERRDTIGMLLLVGKLGEAGSEPLAAVVAQGAFDEKTLIPAIRLALATGKAGLAAEKFGNRTIYLESDAREPFGFVVLDSEHIAVGSRDSLASIFKDAPFKKESLSASPTSVVFGHLTFGPRVTALIPQALSPIQGIDFQSTDGQTMTAKIPCGGIEQAKDVRMFLEGVRSVLSLQGDKNPALLAALKGISIEDKEGVVTVSADATSALKLLGTQIR